MTTELRTYNAITTLLVHNLLYQLMHILSQIPNMQKEQSFITWALQINVLKRLFLKYLRLYKQRS